MKVKKFLDILNENSDLDRSYKAASKFGITYDPNKEFVPDNLKMTRYQIALRILEVYFEHILDVEEFIDFEDNVKAKITNDLCQMLSDQDCQQYMNNTIDDFRTNADEDQSREDELYNVKEIIKDKKFDVSKYKFSPYE